MAYQRSLDVLPVAGPACIHLRSKGMYVTGEFDTRDPHESSVSHFWCLQTQHVVGPDNAPVTRHACTPGRGCYCVVR